MILLRQTLRRNFHPSFELDIPLDTCFDTLKPTPTSSDRIYYYYYYYLGRENLFGAYEKRHFVRLLLFRDAEWNFFISEISQVRARTCTDSSDYTNVRNFRAEMSDCILVYRRLVLDM